MSLLAIIGIVVLVALIFGAVKFLSTKDVENNSSRLVGGGSRLVTPRTGIDLNKSSPQASSPAPVSTPSQQDENDDLLSIALTAAVVDSLLTNTGDDFVDIGSTSSDNDSNDSFDTDTDLFS